MAESTMGHKKSDFFKQVFLIGQYFLEFFVDKTSAAAFFTPKE
jgi:hypothetical protein